MFERFADTVTAHEFVDDWIAVNKEVEKAGLARVDNSFLMVWSRVLVPLPAVLDIWGVTLQKIPQMVQRLPPCQWGWTYKTPEKTVTCYSDASTELTLQCTVISRMPSSVQKAEAAALLPKPGWYTFF